MTNVHPLAPGGGVVPGLGQAMAHHCVAQGFAITTDGVLECLADVVRRPVSVSDYLDFCLNISQSFSPLLCFGQGGLISPGGGLCQVTTPIPSPLPPPPNRAIKKEETAV